MCGIAGIAALHAVNPKAVEAMGKLMAHRGPDDQGIWIAPDSKTVLGHQRLAIIDTSSQGHQPMRSGYLTIVFNGEIYNYREIAARLKEEGAILRSQSDTEVILAAYKAWGEDCLKEFNGMFAFAIHDRRNNKLFCARDRFGEKPFLYCLKSEFFAFASEYKALLKLKEVSSDYDVVRLMRFMPGMNLGLDSERKTLFRDIAQLLPGEYLILDLNSFVYEINRYWQITPQPEPQNIGWEEAVAQFRDLLKDSIKLRLRSDVPLGSCLSGGLDSSSIVCLAREMIGTYVPYNVFTGRFPGTSADEWEYAVQVIEQTKAVSHRTEPRVKDFIEELPQFIWHNELPVGSTSQYAQWRVFKLAKERNVTVLLDGQGSDEILGGYEQYFATYLASTNPSEEAAIRARYPLALPPKEQNWRKTIPWKVKHWLAQKLGKGSDPLFGMPQDLAKAVLMLNQRQNAPEGFSPLGKALYRDSFIASLPSLLRYGDRNSMAHAREVRLPFCDHRIAEFVFSLPPAMLMGDAQTKRILREAMRGILPEGIANRWNKQGFLPPQEIWFKEAIGDMVAEIINAPDFTAKGIWDRKWWQLILARFRNGENNLAWILWRPLIWSLWQEHFLKPVQAMEKISLKQQE